MRNKPTAEFDAKRFLTKAGTGRSVSVYRKKQVVFTQGDRADSVFYLERGQIKLAVISDTGKRRSWPCSDAVTSLAKGVSQASPFGWPLHRQSPM